MDVFEQARAVISASLIESLLNAPNAEWRGDEYWTLNPTRGDSNIGSFSISQEGLWHDFASNESGDLITLISESQNISKKEAAEEIIRKAGATPEAQAPIKKEKRQKVEAQIPAPETALKQLNAASSASWAVERYGSPVKGWVYRMAAGGVAYAVTRHEKTRPDGSIEKDVVPWYFGVDNKWHNGHALEHGRLLYKLDQIVKTDKATPILIVEGEKCASVDVQGYMVTTWPGGSSATGKVDWSPLEDRDVIIWPDADNQKNKTGTKSLLWESQPGMKAALAIKNRLPHARILDVKEKAQKKNGWDLADAIADGVDPVEFIAAALKPELPSNEAIGDAGPFVCLGYDETRHWFMRRGMRIPFAITMGTFNQSKLLELAELSWWSATGHTTDQESIRCSSAQDFVGQLSRSAGRYEPDRIRGAGVWRDRDGIIVNDGRRLIRTDGSVTELDEYKSAYHYISSSVQFGSLIGAESSDEDGRTLQDLFLTQGFLRQSHAILAMGWSLIASFGGILKWRPHIWVTGQQGTGKSWMLEELIQPLCGPFAHKGSGKDTEAGIRRALNQDARSVILDEMEPKGQRASEKISSILDLARNSSSDGSGYITIASTDGGTQRFVIRSCFCFGSIQIPDEGAAIASRISRLELKKPASQEKKKARSKELYVSCGMDDPGRFTRRTFHALHRILSDIEWMRSAYLGIFGEQRKIDQLAPLLAAAWAAQSSKTIEASEDGREWLEQWIGELSTPDDIQREDEEAVIDHILSAHIRVDNGIRTVGELLHTGYVQNEVWAQDLLGRFGIRVYTGGLAIVAKSDQIKAVLKDTPYASGYGAQIRRHRLCIDEKARQVRMAGQSRSQCYVLDWDKFKDEYISEKAENEMPF